MKMTVQEIHEALWCMACDGDNREIKSIVDGKINFADGSSITIGQGIARFEKEILGIIGR